MERGKHAEDAMPQSDTMNRPQSGFARFAQRFFGQDLLNITLLIGLAFSIANPMLQAKEFTDDSDLWWHLADARIVATTHHFIHVEPYAFTVSGAPWINPEWLGEMPYWFGYATLGLRGIHLVALLGLFANLIFIYFRSVAKSGHRQAALWTSVLAFFLITVNTGARTIVVAYLAMSAEMAILEFAERGKKQLLWLLPPLFCLWINLHGSWIIGMGFLGLYILCGMFELHLGIFEQRRFTAADRNRLIAIFVGCVAALFINPYGWQLVWNPFDMLMHQKLMLSLMVEWQPMKMGSSTGIAAAIAICAMIVANFAVGRKWKLYELAFILAAWYFAFSHQRFAYLACIVTIPWLTADLARSFYGKPSAKTIPALNALFAVLVAAAIVYYFPAEPLLQAEMAESTPLHSIAAIQPSWRTYNDYTLGGIFAFEGKPDFVDSRNDTFEHHGVLQDFLAIEGLHDPLGLLDKYNVDHALIHTNTSLSYALEHSPLWTIQEREGAGANEFELLARNAATGAH